jgi:hypothetical protein
MIGLATVSSDLSITLASSTQTTRDVHSRHDYSSFPVPAELISGAASLGTITSDSSAPGPRILQLALKIRY